MRSLQQETRELIRKKLAPVKMDAPSTLLSAIKLEEVRSFMDQETIRMRPVRTITHNNGQFWESWVYNLEICRK